jgi:hypothetical protein
MILPGTSAIEVSSFERSDGSSKLNFHQVAHRMQEKKGGKKPCGEANQTVLPLFESLRDVHSDRDNCIKDVSSQCK